MTPRVYLHRVMHDPEIQLLLDGLRRRLTDLYGDRLVRLVLYGSHARGDARPGSGSDARLSEVAGPSSGRAGHRSEIVEGASETIEGGSEVVEGASGAAGRPSETACRPSETIEGRYKMVGSPFEMIPGRSPAA